jgi:hypothetical protein
LKEKHGPCPLDLLVQNFTELYKGKPFTSRNMIISLTLVNVHVSKNFFTYNFPFALSSVFTILCPPHKSSESALPCSLLLHHRFVSMNLVSSTSLATKIKTYSDSFSHKCRRILHRICRLRRSSLPRTLITGVSLHESEVTNITPNI